VTSTPFGPKARCSLARGLPAGKINPRFPLRAIDRPGSKGSIRWVSPRRPLVASLKSVAAVFRFQSGDQRLISREAG
jgi:hypothetical protein